MTVALPLVINLARLACPCGEPARCYAVQLAWRHPRLTLSCGAETCSLLALAAVSELPEAARLWARTKKMSATTRRIVRLVASGVDVGSGVED